MIASPLIVMSRNDKLAAFSVSVAAAQSAQSNQPRVQQTLALRHEYGKDDEYNGREHGGR